MAKSGVRYPADGTTEEVFVNDQVWKIGPRYRAVKALGSGSFSTVAAAVDTTTGTRVALKRIPNVLSSWDNAKRVLREVCILRRIEHPNIIGLYDAFVRPSSNGPMKFKDGKFTSSSIDLYLAMEIADGDLFNMRGQLSAQDVQDITYQLLQAARHLHSMHLWHRDVKSANVLYTTVNGRRIVKLADLGSARSAVFEGKADWARRSSMDASRPEESPDTDTDVSESGSPRREAPGRARGFAVPLTGKICTPSYRAPEVVLSRGGYSSAMDMWSVGCIFGELLARIVVLGGNSTPHLSVQPLIPASGQGNTPREGERFTNSGDSVTKRELQALFDVVGTPAWACIESVPDSRWRRYLQRLPGQASTLYRRFGQTGEVAVDLLGRLLTFDPARRCSAAEALQHEYFAEAAARDAAADTDMAEAGAARRQSGCGTQTRGGDGSVRASERALERATAEHYYLNDNPAHALAQLESEMAAICNAAADHPDRVTDKLRVLIERECEAQTREMEAAHSASLSSPRDMALARERSEELSRSPNEQLWRALHNCDGPGFARGSPEEYALLLDPNNPYNDRCDADRRKITSRVFSLEALSELQHASESKGTESHLSRGRHDDWTESTGRDVVSATAGWGVCQLPPGEGHDDRTREAVRAQQLR